MKDLIVYVQKRLQRYNQNWLCVITGQTGTGKSWSALRIAESIDPTFNIKRVVFTPEDLMKLLNEGDLQKGNAIVFDEAGVGIPAKEWYTIQNKVVNYILQTFRHRNLAVIFTVPSLSFIDKGARKLFHAYIETNIIDREKGLVNCKWFEMIDSSRFEKTYFKYPVVHENGFTKRLNSMNIGLPSEAMIKKYEEKKLDFAVALGHSAEKDIQNAKEVVKNIDFKHNKMRDISIMAEEMRHDTRVTIATIQNRYNVSQPIASRVRSAVMKLREGSVNVE